jgi:hypothetical protein
MRLHISSLTSNSPGVSFQSNSFAQCVAFLIPKSSIIWRNMKVSTSEAFSIFETWMSSTAGLIITGPLDTEFGRGEGKFPAKVVDVDSHSERITVVIGTPGIGSREIRLELAGSSFAVESDSGETSALTAQFSTGARLFFVKVSSDTGHTPVA